MKIKTILIMLIFLALLGTTVRAATGKITNAGSGLILREKPSKSGDVIFTIANGKEVEVLGKEGDWYKVKYNGEEGYLFSQFVKIDEEVEVKETETEKENSNTKENTTIMANTDIKVYIMPQITSTVILTITKDAKITVIEEAGNWSYINVNNKLGWVRTSSIKAEEPKQEEKPAETEPAKSEETKPVEKTEEPKKQEETKPTETKPEETKPVETAKETKPATTLKKGYINVESANVREKPSTDSKVVTNLLLNADVEIIEESGDWYKISFQNKYFGYVAKRLISANEQ